MDRRVRSQLVAAALLIAAAFAAPSPGAAQAAPVGEPMFSTLASYTFDEGRLDSGPDTFRVFESARGRVTRSRHFRFSGEHSLELRDAPGNGRFPELMGFFDERQTGQVYLHFAFLTPDPREDFNVALVGPGWFRMTENGFSIWLANRGGTFTHITDGIPKKLFEVKPFTWYQVDVLYDVDRGTYTLVVKEEGFDEPVASLVDQPNAINLPGSTVSTFSFVSDPFEDLSRVVYYVDDIVIAADEKLDLPGFVAPGRRHLFVQMYADQLVAEADHDKPEARLDPWIQLLREGDYTGALRLAEGELAHQSHQKRSTTWLERAADSALLAGKPALALEFYSEAVASNGDTTPLMLKRADAHYLLGDLKAEKRLREAIYGTLEPAQP